RPNTEISSCASPMTMTEKKILIIDGHPIYINKMDGFLKGLTFQNVLMCPSGTEALNILEAERPDLVLLSGMLPDCNSLDLCRQIKASQPSVRIIVQTGLFTQASQIEELMGFKSFPA